MQTSGQKFRSQRTYADHVMRAEKDALEKKLAEQQSIVANFFNIYGKDVSECGLEELTKREALARQQGFEEGKQAGRDEVLNKQRVWCEVHGYGCGCNESTCIPRPNKPTKE